MHFFIENFISGRSESHLGALFFSVRVLGELNTHLSINDSSHCEILKLINNLINALQKAKSFLATLMIDAHLR